MSNTLPSEPEKRMWWVFLKDSRKDFRIAQAEGERISEQGHWWFPSLNAEFFEGTNLFVTKELAKVKARSVINDSITKLKNQLYWIEAE